MGNIGGPAIIASVSSAVLGVIAASAIGATITGDVYKFESMVAINYLYIWDLTAPNNEFYGPYETMHAV